MAGDLGDGGASASPVAPASKVQAPKTPVPGTGAPLASAPLTLVPMALLLCAVSYATESQGAFYPGPFHLFVVLVGAALLASVGVARSWRWARTVLGDPLVIMAGALALVTVVSSTAAGHAADAIGPVCLLLMMAAVVAVVKALRPEHRHLLVTGVVVIAVVVAAIGWVALVTRRQPDALTSQGLWRAASTLTYENALAAFLTAPALLCLDRLMTASSRSLVWSEAAYVLLLGIGASLSRGGVLGLVVGLAVLTAFRGLRTVARVGPPVVASLIALAGLAPGLPVGSSRHALLACAGLVVGGVAAAWTFRSRRLQVGAAVAGTAVVGAIVAVVSTGHVAGDIAQARFSAASSDRAHEWEAAFDVARHHLLLGVGTARVLLQWQEGGKIFTATFAHNEFLQLLVQDGIVGLVVLLCGLAWIVVRLAHLRGRSDGVNGWSAECAMASLIALLVQSALDFLWHLPVIPVLMAVVLATVTATSERAAVPRTGDGATGAGAGTAVAAPPTTSPATPTATMALTTRRL
jgi:hypothetical protein